MSEKSFRKESREHTGPSHEDHDGFRELHSGVGREGLNADLRCIMHTVAQTEAVIWQQNREWWQKIHLRYIHGFGSQNLAHLI